MKPKKTIIILHGWGLSGEKFTELADEYRSLGYTVHVPDMPGFGREKEPENPLFLADYSGFLRTYIAQNHITAPILIGHSFGGRVILKYLYTNTNDVRAIILTGTPGYPSTNKIKFYISLLIAKCGHFLLSVPGMAGIATRIQRWFYYRIGVRDFYRASGSMRQTFKNVVAEPLHDPMTSVAVPTLLLWGETDQIVPLWVAKKMTKTIIGSSLIAVPNVGHALPYREPRVFVQKTLPFLSTL